MPPKKERGRLGRRVVIAVYAIALSYLVIVGFASVIPQVFWPERDPSFDVSCDEGFRLLLGDLERIRIQYLTGNTPDRENLRLAFEPWDLRFNALRDRCSEEKVSLLNKYRYRVQLNLQRYVREDAPFANQVAEALAPAPENTTSTQREVTP